ncbi:LiaF domain-containing protein [Candidatus Contubernalis alkaliaceticus]|uniref:LiaF domain-containing protein n=1 Tax=Candidatus Contubernalis alkaliaceticus TaxID=338645 RepID=UPI001F4C1B53|nr:LiaF domain-containing protein [Candidatus Contubernalis alkalaceticus]UNC91934.1 cell wall-active antibiotics response protein [Candidatus Contubernalis alkalaceticus]
MRFLNTRFTIGILIVFIGVSAMLNALEIATINIGGLIKTYWPVILILWGLNSLMDYFRGSGEEETRVLRSLGELVSGLIVLALGVLFLGGNLDLIGVDFRLFWKLFWPVIIIIFGISMIRGRVPKEGGKNHWAFMGGIEMGKSSFKLQSGTYFAVMGGIDLDLNKAEIPEGETVLDLTAIMGGIDIIVPRDLPIICEGTTLLGGIDFLKESTGGIISTKKMEYRPGNNQPRIRFVVRTLMGGVSIKH